MSEFRSSGYFIPVTVSNSKKTVLETAYSEPCDGPVHTGHFIVHTKSNPHKVELVEDELRLEIVLPLSAKMNVEQAKQMMGSLKSVIDGMNKINQLNGRQCLTVDESQSGLDGLRLKLTLKAMEHLLVEDWQEYAKTLPKFPGIKVALMTTSDNNPVWEMAA